MAVSTFHPGNQTLQTRDPGERQRRNERRIQTVNHVALSNS